MNNIHDVHSILGTQNILKLVRWQLTTLSHIFTCIFSNVFCVNDFDLREIHCARSGSCGSSRDFFSLAGWLMVAPVLESLPVGSWEPPWGADGLGGSEGPHSLPRGEQMDYKWQICQVLGTVYWGDRTRGGLVWE